MKATFQFLVGMSIMSIVSCKKNDDIKPTQDIDQIALTNVDHIQITRKANFPDNKKVDSYNVSMTINNKGYYLVRDKAFWEYDPEFDKWTQKMSYKGNGQIYVFGFALEGKGYIGSGYSFDPVTQIKTESYHDFWEYEPAIDNWIRKADLIPADANNGRGFSIGNLGYVSFDGQYFCEYNPALNKWTVRNITEDLIRINGIGFSIGTKGYVGFGSFNYPKNDLLEYNPTNDTWTSKGIFEQVVNGKNVSLINRGYVIYLGTTHGEALVVDAMYTLWSYNATSNTWRKRAELGMTGSFEGGFTIGDKVYALTKKAESGQLYELVITE